MTSWQKAIAKPGKEFATTPLKVISGKIPEGIRGTLYRNGPGRLTRGQQQVGHWFDGDGAILGVNFAQEGATATYRYVQTEGYLAETKADKYLFPNYGMTASGAFWNNFTRPVKNSANTSVLALGDRLLALWEGGAPYSLDLDSLETLGQDNLDQTLTTPFSAHPKVDATTGEIFNFGITPGAKNTLHLYKCDRTGKVVKQNSLALSGLPLIHDFVLAGDYLVFFIPPVRVNVLPIILGQKSYCDAMQWQPKLGTQIWICDRHNLELIAQSETEPWYQWHFSNGCLDETGNLVIEFVRYEDFATNQYLREVATGKTTTPAKGQLWQIVLDPKTAQVLDSFPLLERHCAFPLPNPQFIGKSWRYTYLSTHREEVINNGKVTEEVLTAIARYDRQTSTISIADMGADIYPCEPIYVSNNDNPDLGWLLTVVYNGNQDRSEVRIYQSDRLEDEPLCCLALTEVIPHGFHGTWSSQ